MHTSKTNPFIVRMLSASTIFTDNIPGVRRMNLGPMSGQDKGQRAPAIHTVKEDPNMPDSEVIVSCHMLPLSSDYCYKSLKKYKICS